MSIAKTVSDHSASGSSGMLSSIGGSVFTSIKAVIMKWVIIFIVIGVLYWVISNHLCDIIPEEYRDACETITGFGEDFDEIIDFLVEGLNHGFDFVGDVADEGLGAVETNFMFHERDESLSTDRYNWELKSVAESVNNSCPEGSPCEEVDNLSECTAVDMYGISTVSRFYNKKCYLKHDIDNPNILDVGTTGNRYEAGREPIEYTNGRFEEGDNIGRFIPKEGYSSRIRDKELAIQSGELVDICSLQSMEECNTYHEDAINHHTGEDQINYLCQYDDTQNICKFKENPDCANKNTIESCDQLNDNSDYKCKYNNDTTTCETVPLYSLSSSYDLHIPGRDGDNNNYYSGCFHDILGDHGNSGLLENSSNTCNLDTIKNIVYSYEPQDGSTETNPYIITQPTAFGLQDGQVVVETEGTPGCATTSSAEADIYFDNLDITPTQFRVPYCFEYKDPRSSQEDEATQLSLLNNITEYSSDLLVGDCSSITSEDECNSNERCEYNIDGQCVFKPERICNEYINCNNINDEATCNFAGLRNMCEWEPDEQDPSREQDEQDSSSGRCIFKDCIPLHESHCSSLELEENKYVGTCNYTIMDNYCALPSDHEQGDAFECDAGNICPGRYYRGERDRERTYRTRTDGEGVTATPVTEQITENANTCYMNCNSSAINQDTYRCPYCTGTNPEDTEDDARTYPSDNPESDPYKCKHGYSCVHDGDGANNVCINEDSLQSLSSSMIQADLCFSPPYIAGDNDVNRYSYWNFGSYEATAPAGDDNFIPQCALGNGVVSGLYSQDRGFSPIIQTLFGDTVPFIDEDSDDPGSLSICINKNPEEKSIYNCKLENQLFDHCNSNYCKSVYQFDANSLVRGGYESSTCDSPDNCFNHKYITHLECYEGTVLEGETENERLHRCRLMRYTTLKDNMIHLRKFLNININEEEESVILNHILDGQTTGTGIPTIGSIHPCANEDAYLEFYRNLHTLKNSIYPEDRNKYRRAICLLNTGTASGSPCRGEVNINADGTEGEWISIMPAEDSSDRPKLLRGWVHAGEPLTQDQANDRHTGVSEPVDFHETGGVMDDDAQSPGIFDIFHYESLLSSGEEGHCVPFTTLPEQQDICTDITTEEAPTTNLRQQVLSFFRNPFGDPEPVDQADPDEYHRNRCNSTNGCVWNPSAERPCDVTPEMTEIINNAESCRDVSDMTECNISSTCRYEQHSQPVISGLDKINFHYRKEYGNMLEQLCHYSVEHDSQSHISGDINLSSVRYSPIITGDDGEHLCSPCRYKGDSSMNRCSKENPTGMLECISGDFSEAAALNSNYETAADNICNDDGSCRCAELNYEGNSYKWYLENHNSTEINKKCITSSDETCKNDTNLIYTNDNFNEGVYGVRDDDAKPLCDCRGDDSDNTIYFGPSCEYLNSNSNAAEEHENSCHGAYSEYEFSFDGTDYRKIEYINNKINLLDNDNKIFYSLLKYLRVRVIHANHNPDSKLYTDFWGNTSSPMLGRGFWKNIEERSKKKIHRDLKNPDNWSPIDSSNPNADWDGEYSQGKYALLNKFPFSLKDILLEIQINGYKYSPTQSQLTDKDNYIFPNHLGSQRFILKNSTDVDGNFDSPWNVTGNYSTNDDLGVKRIYSPDSLFYDFYRNSSFGPTLCDCTRDYSGNYINDTLYDIGDEAFGSKDRKVENQFNDMTSIVNDIIGMSKGHDPHDNYKSGQLYTYWGDSSKEQWGYRCELETTCAASGANNSSGKPVYSSLGWSLPAELGGRSTLNSGSTLNERNMNNFNQRDNWRYKGSNDNYLWPVTPGPNENIYNTYFPESDNNRLSHGGPGIIDGCKFLNDNMEITDCELNNNRELNYGTTWDQIKKRRSDFAGLIEGDNRSADYLKYDVSEESGRLPDYFDLKGHKPLLCDCSHSLTLDNYNQPGDSNSPSFGDYCQYVTNQTIRNNEGGGPRDANDYIQAHNQWMESTATTDGVCNPNNLLNFELIEQRSRATVDGEGDSQHVLRPAPNNDCTQTPSIQIDDPNGNNYFVEGAQNSVEWKSQVGNRQSSFVANNITYNWSCENQRDSDTCDSNIGPCICMAGTCENQPTREQKIYSPLNYSVLNDNGYITREGAGGGPVNSGDDIFAREIQDGVNRGINLDNIHPITKINYRTIGSEDELNAEYEKRGIRRVRKDFRRSLCECGNEYLQGSDSVGCNMENTAMCSGHGDIVNHLGSPICDCEPGYVGHDCSDCDSNHYKSGGQCIDKIGYHQCCPSSYQADNVLNCWNCPNNVSAPECQSGNCNHESIGCNRCD